MSPAGVVLTGGASRRMGTDKAFVEVDGVPMALRVARSLEAAGCRPVWCQGGDAPRLEALGLVVHADQRPGDGPLPAIAQALAAAPGGVVIAACDLPGLTPEAVGALFGSAGPAALATGGMAHLVAWFPQGAVGRLTELVDDGLQCYQRALRELGATLVEVAAAVVRNVNSPTDLSEPVRSHGDESRPEQ